MAIYQYPEGLESERLITRKLSLDDIPAWAEFFTTPETTEFLKAHALGTPEENAYKWIDRQLNRYTNEEYGHQAILDKNTGKVVGQCGLLVQDIDGNKKIEVGYHMLKKHWGQGYAPEAARIFFNYGFAHDIAENIISMIDVNNIKSQRVAEKNGLKRGTQVRWKDMDIFIYSIDKQDWR